MSGLARISALVSLGFTPAQGACACCGGPAMRGVRSEHGEEAEAEAEAEVRAIHAD